MDRARNALLALGVVAVGATGAGAARAQATLASGDAATLEQRVAIAIGPSRSTVWVAVHARPDAGGFALIVPARAGATIDLATDAWLASLEAATAPRILPPAGIAPVCPGDPPADPVHVAGDLVQHDTLAPAEAIAIEGAGELLLWAAENELAVPGPVASALAGSDATHFVALRFTTPGGDAWTPTVRVAFEGAEPVVPLALAQAGSTEQSVTLFAFSSGRAAVPGAEVFVDGGALTFDVARETSDYFAARSSLLEAPGTFVVEAASHDVLVETGALPGGATIPSVVDAYFQRAADLGAASGDPDACAGAAASAIERPEPFARACARGDLGVVDGGAACVEAPEGGETDPDALRCGGDADDLALALSGLAGDGAWLTRFALRIAPGETGDDTEVTAAPGDEVDPTLVAGAGDFSNCGEGGGGEGGAGATSSAEATGQNGAGPAGPGAGPGGFTTVTSGAGEGVFVDVPVRVYDTSCGCSGDYVIVDYISVSEEEVPDSGSYYAEDDGCDGDTAESYETSDVESSSADDEDCSGDTSETSDESSSDDGCSGDTSDSSDDSGDDGSDGSADDSGDDGSDDGSDDGGDDGCGCDSESLGADEAAKKKAALHKATRGTPKFSFLAFGLVALLAPLRRLTRERGGKV